LTSEHLVGSAANYAYTVKAGPFVLLNGHEGYDSAAPVAGAAGFPAYGKPGLRREADFIFERMGQNLKTLDTDVALSPGSLPLTQDGKVAGLAEGDDFPGLRLRSQLQANTIFEHAEAIAKAAAPICAMSAASIIV
jgi:hypothetical protein